MKSHFISGALLLAAALPTEAATITAFSPDAFNANGSVMNSTLGLASGFLIEDFADESLIAGLSITFENGVPSETITALPTVFANNGLATWDGSSSLISTPSQTCPDFPGGCGSAQLADTVTFNIVGGTRAFGVGLVSFQSLTPSADFPITNHSLLINGVEQTFELEQLLGASFEPGAFTRNAYLVITASPSESPIFSVGFKNVTATDLLSFDHVAVATVPVPTSMLLFVPALLGLMGACHRARENRA